MNINKKRYIISLSVIVIGLIALISGTSYAILSGSSQSTHEQIIRAGSVELRLTENYENIDKGMYALPDEDGLLQEEFYEFTISNIGSTSAKYDLKLLNNEAEANKLSDEYIKVGLEVNGKEMGPMSLNKVGNVIDSEVINKGEVIRYKLRLWLDATREDELVGLSDKNAVLSLKVDAKQSEKKINNDETEEVWKKADSENKNVNYQWYDYNDKMWANSVTVSSTNRSTYLNATPGTTIPMNDILTMQVWIPRYKYKVWNYNVDGTATSSPQQIDIIFEKGTESTGDITCSDTISGTDGAKSESCLLNNVECTDITCNNKTYTHPAFTFGEDELKGFWVGKFEMGETSNCQYNSSEASGCDSITLIPYVKPDIHSWDWARVGTFDTVLRNMNSSNNIYGFSSNEDTHMIKNIEWGAVTYFTYSKYGLCDDGSCGRLFINNSGRSFTGRSGGNIGGSTAINTVYTNQTSTDQYNSYGFYTYDGYLLNYDTNKKSSTKDITKIASSTKTIYGVYDLSGGSYEFTMGNMVSSDGNTLLSGVTNEYNAGFTGIISDEYNNETSYTGDYTYPSSKYIDKYSYGYMYGTVGKKYRGKLGDAIKEVSLSNNTAWYGETSIFMYPSSSWYRRGGDYYSVSSFGLFYCYPTSGTDGINYSSRLVISNVS